MKVEVLLWATNIHACLANLVGLQWSQVEDKLK